MAYIVQLHNGIYSQSAVQYLRRISRIIDRNKPVILVAHQFAGDSIASFNATVRQLRVITKYIFKKIINLRNLTILKRLPLLLMDIIIVTKSMT